jgi:ABC-type Fe3+ transport system permease subunit
MTTSRDLSLFILLVSAKTQVLSLLIYEMAQEGIRQLSYALMTTLVIITLIIIGIYRLYDRYSKKALVEKGIL